MIVWTDKCQCGHRRWDHLDGLENYKGCVGFKGEGFCNCKEFILKEVLE